MARPYNYFFFAAILFILSFFTQHEHFGFNAEAKEIEATSEWTLLGENDTVPAGLHVKVDLSTGQKWAKLVDENEDDDDPASGEAVEAEVTVKGDAVAAASLSVSTSTSASVTGGVVSTVSISKDDDDSSETKEEKDSYDYAAMHRTLSNLPVDEKERMGGLPELPASYGSSSLGKLTAKEKAAFEKRMKEIWEARQEELQKIQEDYVADMPKILKARIEVLKSYVQDPSEHLRNLKLDDEFLYPPGKEKKTEESTSLDIVETLKDLEYHLSDLDMARDFYTLGGWPYLVSLLSDSVHFRAVAPENETSPELIGEVVDKINYIQSRAAFAVGTAVKNSEEFHGWATEKIILVESGKDGENEEKARSEPLSVVSLLVSAIKASSSPDGRNVGDKRYIEIEKQKNLYALGALLRGNRSAQRHFTELGGPNALLDSVSLGVTAPERKYATMATVIGYDIVADLVLHGTEEGMSEDEVKKLIDEFTTLAWCELPLHLLSMDNYIIKEKALECLGTLSPYCVEQNAEGDEEWGEKAVGALNKFQKELIEDGSTTEGSQGEDDSSDDDDDGIDPVYKKELLDLINGILVELKP